MSSGINARRPRRNCRDRGYLSQPAAPARNILQQSQAPLNAMGNASQPLPILVQPSPKPVHRTQSRINQNQAFTHSALPTATPLELLVPSQQDQVVCPMCALDVNDSGLICDRWNTWFHYRCLFITDEEFIVLSYSSDNWFCDHWKSVSANRIR